MPGTDESRAGQRKVGWRGQGHGNGDDGDHDDDDDEHDSDGDGDSGERRGRMEGRMAGARLTFASSKDMNFCQPHSLLPLSNSFLAVMAMDLSVRGLMRVKRYFTDVHQSTGKLSQCGAMR